MSLALHPCDELCSMGTRDAKVDPFQKVSSGEQQERAKVRGTHAMSLV